MQIKFLDAVRAVAKNKLFWVISLAGWIGFLESTYGNMLQWCYQYHNTKEDGVGAGLYTIITMVVANANLWGMLAAPFCIKKWGKKAVLIFTNALNAVILFLLYPVVQAEPPKMIVYIAIILFGNYLMSSFGVILTPAVNADIRDYQQYLTGERIDGMFSTVGLIGTVITLLTSGIVSAVLTQTAEVACDSLSIKIIGGKSLDEIERVYAYKNNKLIFNGYCDCQRTTADERGFETYIYARSSACLLVDNDAFAYTYNRPSAQSLFDAYAKPFGFSYKLDDICTFKKYEVSSGSSLYGAINLLVSTITGNSIRINADNEIFMLKPSENILSLNDFSVISAKSIINRSEPISAVNYKKEFSYLYDCHTYSQLAEKLGFSRQRYVNLAALSSGCFHYLCTD